MTGREGKSCSRVVKEKEKERGIGNWIWLVRLAKERGREKSEPRQKVANNDGVNRFNVYFIQFTCFSLSNVIPQCSCLRDYQTLLSLSLSLSLFLSCTRLVKNSCSILYANNTSTISNSHDHQLCRRERVTIVKINIFYTLETFASQCGFL